MFKRNSIKSVSSRQSIRVKQNLSFSLSMDGNILDEVASNTFKKQRATIVSKRSTMSKSFRGSINVRPSGNMF